MDEDRRADIPEKQGGGPRSRQRDELDLPYEAGDKVGEDQPPDGVRWLPHPRDQARRENQCTRQEDDAYCSHGVAAGDSG